MGRRKLDPAVKREAHAKHMRNYRAKKRQSLETHLRSTIMNVNGRKFKIEHSQFMKNQQIAKICNDVFGYPGYLLRLEHDGIYALETSASASCGDHLYLPHSKSGATDREDQCDRCKRHGRVCQASAHASGACFRCIFGEAKCTRDGTEAEEAMTYPLDLPGLPVREPAVLPGLGLPPDVRVTSPPPAIGHDAGHIVGARVYQRASQRQLRFWVRSGDQNLVCLSTALPPLICLTFLIHRRRTYEASVDVCQTFAKSQSARSELKKQTMSLTTNVWHLIELEGGEAPAEVAVGAAEPDLVPAPVAAAAAVEAKKRDDDDDEFVSDDGDSSSDESSADSSEDTDDSDSDE